MPYSFLISHYIYIAKDRFLILQPVKLFYLFYLLFFLLFPFCLLGLPSLLLLPFILFLVNIHFPHTIALYPIFHFKLLFVLFKYLFVSFKHSIDNFLVVGVPLYPLAQASVRLLCYIDFMPFYLYLIAFVCFPYHIGGLRSIFIFIFICFHFPIFS